MGCDQVTNGYLPNAPELPGCSLCPGTGQLPYRQIACLEWRRRGHYDVFYDRTWPRAGAARSNVHDCCETPDCLGHIMTSIAKDQVHAHMRPAGVSLSAGAPRMADDDRKRKGDSGGPGTAVITKTKPQTKRPNLYRVLILNDDYTPMEFVVHVLETVFRQGSRSRDPHHVACASPWDRRMRGLYL